MQYMGLKDTFLKQEGQPQVDIKLQSKGQPRKILHWPSFCPSPLLPQKITITVQIIRTLLYSALML